MTNDHDGVRELLAAWAVGALPPGDRRTVPLHLAGCESCAAEAERLRDTVRLLDGTPGPSAVPGGSVNGSADGVLALALRSRRPRAAEIAHHAAPYAAAVAGLQALVPELDDRWGTPVVHGWDAHATVAHLVAADEHLAVRLGLDTRLPASHIPEGMPAGDAWDRRTADVIAHEHGRTPGETVATWAAQAAALLATPEAGDPELAARPVTVMGLRLPVADHFVVRAFEAWIHTDDIGRALALPVPPPPDEHLWSLVRLAVRILGPALHAAPPVLFEVTGPTDTSWILGDDTESVRAELTLDPVDFCLLVGGRYAPDEVPRGITGDESAARTVLERAASLAWL
ncbi:zf-HC2 domain-containing protein [Streptomyces europaeiscabiei]|uniref:anti-sigma factor family protein n=1 Tax=Streptomyces europaeiscabiei TaxID=146819 RepID=UPI002E180AD6